jgi:hypothetical protein
MGAPSSLNAHNAFDGQGLGANQKLGIFLGVDVVGDDCNFKAIAQGFAQCINQGGFAGTNRASHANSQWIHRFIRVVYNGSNSKWGWRRLVLSVAEVIAKSVRL